MAKSKQSSRGSGPRQYGAIPIRVRKRRKAKVLLLTSRGKGRWGIPKGWPMAKRSPKDTARREAFEEAGLKGWVVDRTPIGRYRYRKCTRSRLGKITVEVFVMKVDRQVRKWPEKPERKTRWFSPDEAAALLPDRLGRMLRKAAKRAIAEA